MSKPLFGSTLAELEADFGAQGIPRWRANQVLGWIHKRGAASFEAMTDLPAALKIRLAGTWAIDTLKVQRRLEDPDGTIKFLFALPDGQALESVLIPAPGRRTLCVSTQVGCAVGCVFCASGLAGFTRNLSAGEIVEQVARARREAGVRVDNLVFMGMGEPFQNYAHVLKAVGILIAGWGAGIGQRHVTVSTSGLPEGIRKFGRDAGQVRLAVSLHAPNDILRDTLVPLNKRHPIPVLLEAVRDYQKISGRQVMWEYVLLGGVNDAPELARELARLVKPFRGRVNLIPFNPVKETGFKAPAAARVKEFADILRRAGVLVTVRREKGRTISAACGQLRLQELEGYSSASPHIETMGPPRDS